jgi:hypothetical protein
MYLTISNPIEILKALKLGIFDGKSIIFCILEFSAASTTRVKSEVQVLYRPPFLYPKRGPRFPGTLWPFLLWVGRACLSDGC